MSRSDVLALPRRLAGWQWFLVAAPVTIALYYALLSHGPGWEPEQAMMYASADASMAVAALLAARRHLQVRGGLLLIAAGAVTGVIGDLMFWITTLTTERVTYLNLSDLAYLTTYLLLAAGLVVLVRRRTPGWDLAGLVDTAIVAVGAGFLVYALVISPTLAAGGERSDTLVALAYPIGDLLLIAVGARLLIGAGPRTVSLATVGTCLALTLVADITYSVQALSGSYMVATYVDAIWMAA
ncbi:hypothetical protein [Actinoplanes sp. TFC3]|uniref:hypothetical protein n=1 Tax=Actinoplanes sp. TFC3 TaxID=1710355 RepID=UPI000834BB35|nr:hypothetical protein [Actinoplanes sp. TFC3]